MCKFFKWNWNFVKVDIGYVIFVVMNDFFWCYLLWLVEKFVLVELVLNLLLYWVSIWFILIVDVCFGGKFCLGKKSYVKNLRF